MSTYKLQLENVNCGGCVRRVTETLEATEGTTPIEVSLETKTATVKLTSSTSIETVMGVLTDKGYPATLLEVPVEEKTKESSSCCGSKKTVEEPNGETSSSCSSSQETESKEVSSCSSKNSSTETTSSCSSSSSEQDAETTEMEESPEPASTVEFDTVRLSIEGMHCSSCVSSVQDALESDMGVREAQINFLLEQGEISFDPASTTPEELIRRVESAGYKATLVEQGQPQPAQAGDRKTSTTSAGEGVESGWLAFGVSFGIAWVAMFLSMPLMSVDGGQSFTLWHKLMSPLHKVTHAIWPSIYKLPHATLRWVLLVSTGIVLVWAGRVFFVRAWKALQHGRTDMNTLIALGTSTAFVWSALITLFPAQFKAWGIPPHVYFEAVPWIIALVMLGNLLEERAKRQARSAIQALAQLQAPTVRKVVDGEEIEVPLESVVVGDRVRVFPESRVPVDGVIVEGESYLDESMLTGEPLPVQRKAGDPVVGGTSNGQGSLLVEVQRTGGDTALARIMKLVEEAQNSRMPIQKLADKVASIFVPTVLGIAVLTLILWGIFGGSKAWVMGMVSAVSVLIIACPCAMGLAVPTAVMLLSSRTAQFGMLIRNGEALETTHRLTTIVLDKTGTLTQGRPRVNASFWKDTTTQEKTTLLNWLHAVEKGSEHPLAQALVSWTQEQGTNGSVEIQQFQSHAGRGVSALVEGRTILLGNHRLLDEQGISLDGWLERQEELSNKALTPVWMVVDGQITGLFGIGDPLKESSREAIEQMKSLGLKLVLLTGDRKETAVAIANQLGGVDEIHAEALPEDKHTVIARLQEAGEVVAMVGDGINDAPALAAAHVGMALGAGTEVARESADITLVSGDLRAVASVIEGSREAMKIIRQNLLWAFGYNTLGIPLAAGLLYPFFGVLLSPEVASLAMAFSSVSVVANSLRLVGWKPSFHTTPSSTSSPVMQTA